MTLYNSDEALGQVAAGLKQVAFDPVDGLTGYDYPHFVPALPAGIVVPPPIDYRVAMNKGVITLEFELWYLERSAAGSDQQKSLWHYLNWGGAKSALALIDANPSLGIVGADGLPRVDAHAMASRPLLGEEIQSIESVAFGAAVAVTVHVTNRS